jgi:hypothetical protein
MTPPLPTRAELALLLSPEDAQLATAWRWEDDTAQFLVVEIPSRKLTLVWPVDSEPVLIALLEPYVARALRGELGVTV